MNEHDRLFQLDIPSYHYLTYDVKNIDGKSLKSWLIKINAVQ